MSDSKPCRSPYCECDEGKCTHPGFYDARSEALPNRVAESSVMKDHEIREFVNELRDLAIKHHDHQSLRDRIAHLVVPRLADLVVAQRTVQDIQSLLLVKTIALSRYEEREKTIGWNQS